MKKSKKKTVSNILLAVVAVSLGILIAWQMKNLNAFENANLFGATNQASLQEQIDNLQVVNAELQKRNDSLNKNLQDLIELGNDENAQIAYYQERTKDIATFAGLTDVKGPGAIITLDVSQAGAEVDAASLLVVCNGLKANGAHAIAINGQRMVALSEISSTGSGENKNIIMNGTNITDPNTYEIKVIGEVDKIRDFYSLSASIWQNLQGKSVQVQIYYPPEVEIPALAEDSPAYRSNLLETIDESDTGSEAEEE